MGPRPKRRIIAGNTSWSLPQPWQNHLRYLHSLKWIILVISITIPLPLWMDRRGSFEELEATALDVSSGLGLVSAEY